MDTSTLAHYGILGMKWGVRRSPAELARARGTKKGSSSSSEAKTTAKSSKKKEATSEDSKPKTKSVSEMSEAELREKISRLELEKRYRDLAKSAVPAPSKKGSDFVKRVLEKSGENIATQLTTYVMGKLVNEALSGVFKDDSIVNPKKGQKDK